MQDRHGHSILTKPKKLDLIVVELRHSLAASLFALRWSVPRSDDIRSFRVLACDAVGRQGSDVLHHALVRRPSRQYFAHLEQRQEKWKTGRTLEKIAA
jgi:hypothetical protein